MKTDKFLLITEICQYYHIETDFFEEIEYHQLLDVHQISGQKFIHQKQLNRLEKILRLHDELDLNLQGIDVVFGMMDRIEKLERELRQTKSKLSILENY